MAIRKGFPAVALAARAYKLKFKQTKALNCQQVIFICKTLFIGEGTSWEGTVMDGNNVHNADATGLSVKKKRGRPRKSETVLLPGEITALGVTPSAESKSKKARLTDTNISHPGHGNCSLVGQPVHGVLDGSFDAGYLISVRVGDTDTVLRGVVFGPGLSIPPSKITDIAPKVKTTNRELNTAFPPLYSPPAATPVALSEIYEPFPGTVYTSTESGGAPENGLEHQPNHTSSESHVHQVHGSISKPTHASANNQS